MSSYEGKRRFLSCPCEDSMVKNNLFHSKNNLARHQIKQHFDLQLPSLQNSTNYFLLHRLCLQWLTAQPNLIMVKEEMCRWRQRLELPSPRKIWSHWWLEDAMKDSFLRTSGVCLPVWMNCLLLIFFKPLVSFFNNFIVLPSYSILLGRNIPNFVPWNSSLFGRNIVKFIIFPFFSGKSLW